MLITGQGRLFGSTHVLCVYGGPVGERENVRDDYDCLLIISYCHNIIWFKVLFKIKTVSKHMLCVVRPIYCVYMVVLWG